MNFRSSFFCAAMLAGALAAVPASAQILFQDNFDSHPDADTASVFQGGTMNDPGGGDADPVAQVGVWSLVGELQPWNTQVSTATNGPTAGPAGGVGKYLTVQRENQLGGQGDVRGDLASAATGLLSIDFQAKTQNGPLQFFVRDSTGGGFSFSDLKLYFDLSTSGTVSLNGVEATSLAYNPANYASIHLSLDVPNQSWSASVNGNGPVSAGFVESVASIRQIAFYSSDAGVFGIDNVLVQVVPEPATALLGLVAGAGLILRRARRRAHR